MIEYATVCTQDIDFFKDARHPIDITDRDNEDCQSTIWRNFKTREAATVEVHRLDASSDWLQDALRALAEIENLPMDWDSRGAEPPNQVAIRNCQLILTQLDKENFKPSLIEPSTDDAVCIGFWAENRYADIECFNDGEILAMTHDRGNSEPRIWEIKINEMSKTIDDFQDFLEK